MLTAQQVSQLLGWAYFVCWSLSFYPQFILNWRTKATEGLSVDFSWLNFLGFTCYAMFNCMMYWNPRVQHDVEIQTGERRGLVQLNDVFFALHALLLTTLTLLQIYYYNAIVRSGSVRSIQHAPVLHFSVKLFIGTCTALSLIMLQQTIHRNVRWDNGRSWFENNAFTWLGFCLFLSFIKLAVTLLKYFPQAILNCRRRSTIGWSIGNVLLDFSGGMLSLAQLCVDSKYTLGSLTHVMDNPVKLFLACFSISFDLVFILQHYVLFPGSNDDDDSAQHTSSVEEDEVVENGEITALQHDALLARASIPAGRRRIPTQLNFT